jgi:hypothetical protein
MGIVEHVSAPGRLVDLYDALNGVLQGLGSPN